MKIYHFSPEKTYNVPLGDIFGLSISKLAEENESVFIAFSDEITSPEIISDFFSSNVYCVNTTFFGISERYKLTFHSADNEDMSASEAQLILINLNTSYTSEEIFNAANEVLDNRKKDLIVITLTGNGGFEIAVGETDKRLHVQVLLAFCDSIGEIISAELIGQF